MAKIIMGWINNVDLPNVVITASSEVGTLPAENLKDEHVLRPWRSFGESPQSVTTDLGEQRAVALMALMGCNLSADSTFRLRASEDDPTMASSVYDSGVIATGVDPRYGLFTHRLPGDIAINARYWLLDINDPNVAYIQCGRLYLGNSWTPKINYAYGWSQSYIDLSKSTRSRGGQSYNDINAQYRQVIFNFELLEEGDAFDGVLELDRVCGRHYDVIALMEPDAANQGQNTIFGLVAEDTPVINPSFKLFQKAYTIEERL